MKEKTIVLFGERQVPNDRFRELAKNPFPKAFRLPDFCRLHDAFAYTVAQHIDVRPDIDTHISFWTPEKQEEKKRRTMDEFSVHDDGFIAFALEYLINDVNVRKNYDEIHEAPYTTMYSEPILEPDKEILDMPTEFNFYSSNGACRFTLGVINTQGDYIACLTAFNSEDPNHSYGITLDTISDALEKTKKFEFATVNYRER